MHVCIDACMHVCIDACMHVCMYACMHVCIHAYMHVCICACMTMKTEVHMFLSRMMTAQWYWVQIFEQHRDYKLVLRVI